MEARQNQRFPDQETIEILVRHLGSDHPTATEVLRCARQHSDHEIRTAAGPAA